MEVFRPEIKAGLTILVSVVILAFGVFMIGDVQSLLEDKRTILLLFKNADGVSKGSPVWYAGYEVGEVSKLRIIHGERDRIALTVEIDIEARIREDSKAYIRNLGMMGAKYVEITPGTSGSRELADGEVLEGETPTSLAEVIERGSVAALQLQETLRDVRVLVKKIQGDVSIGETLQNANAFLLEMRQRGDEIEGVIDQAEILLSTSRNSVEGLAESLEGTSQSVRRITKAGGDEVIALIKALRRTNRDLQVRIASLEEKIDPVIGQAHEDLREAGALVRDARSIVDANDQNIYLLILHLKEVARHLDALSQDLRANPWKVFWKGKGSGDERTRSGPEGWQRSSGSGAFDED